MRSKGRLAQLVRASSLHLEGRGFESLIAHSNKRDAPRRVSFIAVGDSLKSKNLIGLWREIKVSHAQLARPCS